MRHYQAVVRLDTSNPPGNERLVAEYLKQVFDAEGIPSQVLALDASRSNVVARLEGNGRKRSLLIMGHTEVVTIDRSPTNAARAIALIVPSTHFNNPTESVPADHMRENCDSRCRCSSSGLVLAIASVPVDVFVSAARSRAVNGRRRTAGAGHVP
jgi:hypothetical protein